MVASGPLSLLKDGWQATLAQVVSKAHHELVISSPFVTHDGLAFVLANLHPSFRDNGNVTLVTNLAPLNMIQGSTDPEAILDFANQIKRTTVFHLPRLHAKVYARDALEVIVTSGNLTSGGLRLNFEYGVHIIEAAVASRVRADVMDYAGLGAPVSTDQLVVYCAAAKEAEAA